MTSYKVEMKHSEKTFESLARMQYDLFCRENRVTRTALSVVCIAAGILNFSEWWGILLAAYGCYLTTSTYSAANHTAHKLAAGIEKAGLPFPSSRYIFRQTEMEIFSLPEGTKEKRLPYSDIFRLGEDRDYFYIFPDKNGGYMVPKAELKDRAQEFRLFLEKETGQSFRMRTAPIVRFARWIQERRRS